MGSIESDGKAGPSVHESGTHTHQRIPTRMPNLQCMEKGFIMARKSEEEPAVSNRKRVSKTSASPKDQNSPDNPLIVVGIGASAGGLEAFQALFPNLPMGVNIAYVIVQHLDPSHPTMLGSLLQRFTPMPVKEIRDRLRPEPDHVYLTPPGRDATMSNGILHLSKPVSAIGPKPSIDLFFTSLAEDWGDKAVGIILSGTGSDGAHGIRAIKAFGGITIVQDEKTARYNGMPHAAIETGHVDLIFPPEKIGQELLSVLKYPHLIPEVPPEEDRAPDDINKIFMMLAQRTGCDFSEYKINTINRRIGRRMALHKFSALQDYIHHLQKTPEEIDLLLKDILISVTSFFRDGEAFQALAKVFPKIVEKKQAGHTIRVWVPGCSTGEEVYSLAILMAETLGDRLNKYTIQVFGTDLDQEAIERARKGFYPEATVVNVDKKILERYFIRKDNMVQVTDAVREMIVFAKHDLIKDPPFAHLDLISCRNLLIYFNQTLQNRVVPLFHYVLNPNGFLFLGKSESINQYSDLFSPLSKKWRVFERRDVIRAPAVTLKYRQMPNFQFKPTKLARKPEMTLNEMMRDTVLDVFAPPAVMIDDRLQIVCFRGDTSPFLKPPEGEVNLDILQMARENVRIDLRALVHRCSREGTSGASRPLRVKDNGNEEDVIIHVDPVGLAGAPKGLMLVAFEPLKTYQYREKELTPPNGADPRVFELEHELVETRERLQTTIEELETTNEELMSLNEELQSANEELQSTNEELETTTEELQSTNEELNTVNDELQAKSAELSATNADLENILTQIGLPLVIVDKDLRVKRYNLAATDIFSLVAGDIGQVITTVAGRLNLPNLREKLLEVVKHNRTLDEDIEDGQKFYYMQIHPHLDKVGLSIGAMLIFVDKSRLVQTQRELETIASISRVFLASGNLDEIYQKLPDLISKRFNFPYVTVELHEEERGEMIVVGSAGLPRETKLPFHASLKDTICGQVVESGLPLVITDECRETSCRHPVLDKIELKTMICMPLRLQERTLGALVLADRSRRQDVADIRGTLEVIAHHLALEIDRVHKTLDLKQAREELEQRVKERTAALAEANKRLNTELTERKKAQKTLRAANETAEKRLGQLMAVFNSIHEGLIFTEPDGRLLDWNPAAETLLGYREDKTPSFIKDISKSLRFLDPDGKPLPENEWPMERALKGETFSDCEVMIDRKGGESRMLSFSGTSVKGSAEEMILALTTLRDITEQKRAEDRIKGSLVEKEVLLKEIHHRVKNNMQVISSLVSLQADGSDETVRNVLGDVNRRVRSMALVHEKLYQSPDLARIDFAEYARTLLGYLWSAHGNFTSGIQLTMDLEPVSLPVDLSVPCALILNELAANAIKHAFQGRDHAGGVVTISLQRSKKGQIALRVRDNGVGLPEGFDWRKTHTLGLRLVQMLAKQLQADVEVLSAQGTEFVIKFQGPKG
jgi:two-component system CheB/CheR fusion protein